MKLESENYSLICAECHGSMLHSTTNWKRIAKKAVEHFVRTGHSSRILVEATIIVTGNTDIFDVPIPQHIPEPRRVLEL